MSGHSFAKHQLRSFQRVAVAFVGTLLLSLPVCAQQAATVLFADGAISAQSAGKGPRLVGKGSPLSEGDTLTVGERSFAVVEFADQTRTTLRPNTVIGIEQFRHQTSEPDGFVLRLVKGGIRAVTGLIGKARPEAVRIQTPNATIGIRGTSFDARLCAGDCASERHKTPGQPIVASQPVVGRVLLLEGEPLRVAAPAGERLLRVGGAIHEGEILETGPVTTAVIVFDDRTRVTLKPATRFEVTTWRYAKPNRESGNVALRLLVGAVRIATGLVGKANPEGFKVRVVNSTVGIRGTGFDLHCTGECAAGGAAPASAATPAATSKSCGSKAAESASLPPGSGLFAATWDGAISVSTAACTVRLGKGQALYVDQKTGASLYLPKTPGFLDDGSPRPDKVPFDYDQMFGAFSQLQESDGLYAYVRDGHVLVAQDGTGVDLDAGEAAYAGGPGRPPIRLAAVPGFIQDDPYPVPETFGESNGSVLELIRENARFYDSGAPGQCTIR